ncbi:DNA-binding GntR family transcriptional regulator [Mesorhizobium robiniae]|uniref:DNA-binding GntR family transcriptional regulator n=1 Tax=Mesorhizobium robiniae TaxID=559315 RepID=A0ABV2GP78_9HYPH
MAVKRDDIRIDEPREMSPSRKRHLSVDADTHPTATTFATERLRKAILNGELKAGDRLQQHSLAASLGLSHVPLREAFQRLEFEGFIAINPRRGAFVVPLTARDAAEIYELRANLEAAALYASVLQISAEQILVATEICQEADRTQDNIGYGELNWQFHRALYAACDRPRTMHLIETLWQNARRYSMLLRYRAPYIRKSQREHWDILEAVRNRNVDLAVKLLRSHIEAGSARIVGLLEK